MNHNEKIIEIGKRLNADNVADIKGVFVSVIGLERISKITNGLEMIKELEHIGHVSENNYKDLVNLLDNLNRPDLVLIINGEFQPELELTPSLIMEVAYSIAKNWRKFGRHLKLDETRDLDHIDVDSKTTWEKSFKVLNKWVKREEEKQFLTWCNLRKELESFERNDIVEEIQAEYMHKENNEFKSKMTTNQIGKVASRIANNWRDLGRHLNFDENELHHIYLDEKKNDDRAYEILMGCKQKSKDGFLSWNYLKKVLELLDHTDIVTELQADFEH